MTPTSRQAYQSKTYHSVHKLAVIIVCQPIPVCSAKFAARLKWCPYSVTTSLQCSLQWFQCSNDASFPNAKVTKNRKELSKLLEISSATRWLKWFIRAGRVLCQSPVHWQAVAQNLGRVCHVTSKGGLLLACWWWSAVRCTKFENYECLSTFLSEICRFDNKKSTIVNACFSRQMEYS